MPEVQGGNVYHDIPMQLKKGLRLGRSSLAGGEDVNAVSGLSKIA